MSEHRQQPLFAVPRCLCGHTAGDHQGNGAGWPHPLRYGACLIPGCGCLAFAGPDMEARAA
jgi:hypothetical protein